MRNVSLSIGMSTYKNIFHSKNSMFCFYYTYIFQNNHPFYIGIINVFQFLIITIINGRQRNICIVLSLL